MAKLNGGLFSKLKGKVGGVVFQQYEGMNVSKEYQPTVKNPSTAGQVENRARFKAASQLVAIFANIFAIAAANVSPYMRTIRGALVKVLRNAFQYNVGDNSATITTAETVAAVNSLNFNPAIPAPVISGANISSATIQATQDDVVRYKIVALNSDGLVIGQKEVEFKAGASAETIQAPVTAEVPSNYKVAAVAIRYDEESGNAIYGNLLSLNTLEVLYAVASGAILPSHLTMAEIAQS